MKPFGLHTVLEHRKRLENIAQNKLFEAQKVQKRIGDKLNQESSILQTLIAKTESMKQEGVEIGTLIRYEDRINAVSANIIAIRKNLEEKSRIVNEEQANLVQRSKARKVMERLKEEQNRNWQNYLNKKEAAMLDEIAIIRHGPDEM